MDLSHDVDSIVCLSKKGSGWAREVERPTGTLAYKRDEAYNSDFQYPSKKGDVDMKQRYLLSIFVVPSLVLLQPISPVWASYLQTGSRVQRFLDAAANGDIVTVKSLLDTDPDLIRAEFRGFTALHMASEMGNKPMIELLLRKKADVGAVESTLGYTPLHMAARKDRISAARLLLAAGAPINAENTKGRTPLAIAARDGYKDLAALLIEQGADVNIQASDGAGPLHLAGLKGYEPLVRLLLDNGANTSALTANGMTPVDAALANDHADVAHLILKYSQVQASRPAPADPWRANHTIAFASARDGNFDIYRMKLDGSNLEKLTSDPAIDGAPAWSPDGSKIAFHSKRAGNRDIYVMNADGSNLQRLTDHRGEDMDPAWSPDGTMLAYHSDRNGKDDIYVANSDGSDAKRLTDGSADDFAPDWSPDGSKIAFYSNRDDDLEIYVMNSDGSDPKRLTDSPGRDKSPVWSPDGRRIAFHSHRSGNYDLYVMNADGSSLKRLTDGATNEARPSWSPDGQWLVYGVAGSGKYGIYAIRTDGAETVQISNEARLDAAPAWKPQAPPVARPEKGSGTLQPASDSTVTTEPKPVSSEIGGEVTVTGLLVGKGTVKHKMTLMFFKNGKAGIKFGEGGRLLNPFREPSSDDRFTLSVDTSQFDADEFILTQVTGSDSGTWPLLQDGRGAVMVFKFAGCGYTIDVGNVVAKQDQLALTNPDVLKKSPYYVGQETADSSGCVFLFADSQREPIPSKKLPTSLEKKETDPNVVIKLDSARKTLQERAESERHRQEYAKWLRLAETAEKDGSPTTAMQLYKEAQAFAEMQDFASLRAKIDALEQQIVKKRAIEERAKVSVDYGSRKHRLDLSLKGRGWVHDVCFSPAGDKIASTDKGMIRIWDVSTSTCSQLLRGHTKDAGLVCFSGDGNFVASGEARDKVIKVWDSSTGRCLRTIRTGHRKDLLDICFSPDGQLIISASDDKMLKLWDVNTGHNVRTFQGHGAGVFSVDFAPDGRSIASGSWDKTIRLWDVQSGELLKTLKGHKSTIESLAFSPDGGYIAACEYWGNKVIVWDVEASRAIVKEDLTCALCVAFSPGGDHVAVGDAYGQVHILNVKNGQWAKKFRSHKGFLGFVRINAVAFVPDGRHVVVGADNESVKVFVFE